MHTPNIDKLASKSMLFQHAYVQQAVCSPSRTSFLTGRRPDTTRVHDLIHYWRKVAGNFTTLPQYFKEHVYLTAGFGKVFHPGGASGHDDPISWTEDYFHPDEKYWNERLKNSWHAAPQKELEEHPLPDTQTTMAVLKMLQDLKLSGFDKSFFLAVGFHKPHLPFLFPSSFLDLYPREKVQLPNNSFAPRNIPAVAWSDFDELRKYDDILEKYGYGSINTTLPDDIVINLRRAYYASVSYIDSLIGTIMEKLTSVGLLNETIVVFIGDHGWQLGEHGEWCKHTNFELATRAPVLFSVPGITDHGSETNQLVEFVDLFPTIVDAVGLPVPKLCPENSSLVQLCTEGTSFYQLLKYPKYQWKSASFSQYPRMLVSGDNIMGYSLRTQTYRYTEWVYYDHIQLHPVVETWVEGLRWTIWSREWSRREFKHCIFDRIFESQETFEQDVARWLAISTATSFVQQCLI